MLRSETLGHGGPSKVSLRSETLAAPSPNFGLRFFETLAKTIGTLNPYGRESYR